MTGADVDPATAEGLPWPRETRLPLENGVIDIWMCAAPLAPSARRELAGVLSPGEVAQAGRFVADRDRELYVAAHGLLRMLLAAYVGIAPDLLSFAVGRWGKPELEGRDGAGPWFNLAHSGGRALVAVSGFAPVGVDIERHRPLRDLLDVARRFFSDREAGALSELQGEARREAFFRLWTRKEAVVKAAGLSVAGLSREVEVLPVSESAVGGACRIPRAGEPDDPIAWRDLEVGAGYAAAWASRVGTSELRFRDLRDLG